VETSQERGIKFYQKRSLFTTAQRVCMSLFSIVYRKVPYHLLDLAKLPLERSLVVQLALWLNKY